MDVRSADRSPRRGAPAPGGSPTRVLLVVGHRTIRLALRQALEFLGVEVTHDVATVRDALLAASVTRPHVALVDLSTDPTAGVETCKALRDAYPSIRVAALVPRLGPAQYAARSVGASVVITTDATVAEVAGALKAVTVAVSRHIPAPQPRPVLTGREQEVLAMVAGGLTDGQISQQLVISHKTVKNHLHHVYAKLGARGRADAVMLAVRHGLIAV